MSSAAKWWSRVTAAVTGAVLTLMIPAYAWAAGNGVADVAGELAKGRRRGGIGGLIFGVGGLCCLVVVGGIALIVFLIIRSRRKPPPPPH
jgi:hypothetical protein